MIDFSLSDENRLVRQSVREFVAAEILPNIREWDERARRTPRSSRRWASWATSARRSPRSGAGPGMDYVSLAILCEELERADTAFRVVMSVHVGLNSLALLQWATDEQKRRWLVPQAQGRKLATFALTEPGAGTDAAALQATARRDGDAYVLNGSKIWISLADLADHFLVFATVDRTKRHRGRDRLHGGAGDAGPDDRDAPRQARDPGREHRPRQPRQRARSRRRTGSARRARASSSP